MPITERVAYAYNVSIPVLQKLLNMFNLSYVFNTIMDT